MPRLDKTEARQADEKRMNLHVLLSGTAIAVAAVAAVAYLIG